MDNASISGLWLLAIIGGVVYVSPDFPNGEGLLGRLAGLQKRKAKELTD